jgi:membrane protease YdiL (CAAX protease family)
VTSSPRPQLRGAVTLVVATLGFALALAFRDRVDPWRSTATAAAVGVAMSAWTLGPRLRRLFATTPRQILAPVGLGVALVVATHGGFQMIRLLAPDLAVTVRGLYVSIDLGDSQLALAALTAFIVLGEELVWRGVAIDVVGACRSKLAVAAISVALYVAPQLPGHVPVLIIAAAGLGSVFAAQRLATGRLIDSLITHAIWSVAVFVLWPMS